ncbi:leucine-rich repeat and WD repeat-containing protein 1 [Pseudochaenichthys georgianus]|uniref:leucine-rich repeat and WD repeat-containing protein 1 n=1 Tax=Pseudochaenichthys georgianus TaxID=52239 RepID=UPI001469F97A|nr:leucine-rich repeat and WD repeat-containing protein 1 [Pseudochaenichthys georgianus]
MAKVTEKLLLEKGSPKATKLEQIKTLNLSKLTLKLEDLPVPLLSRLSSLECWDLSGNRLEEFPRRLELPALRHLDLSDNQMEDVTSLEALSGLEELKLEDNLYITVSDNHKLMVLLPKLRMYNGKDVTSSANHLRFVYSANLRTRIVAVWEKHFRLPDPVTAEKLSALSKDFATAACQQVRFGPSSVSDFTKWRVAIMAKAYLTSLTEPTKEPEIQDSPEPKETQVVPIKRKQLPSERISLTPRKKLRNSDLPESPAEGGPRESSRKVQMLTESSVSARTSPRKKSQPPPNLTPVRGAATPRRAAKARPIREEEVEGIKQKKKKEEGLQKEDVMSSFKSCGNTQPVSLKPLHVLQCHSKQDSREDFSTQLWACAFQPQTETGSGSRLAATCGGDSLCVIDCETGMVMKKYKVSGEEFFSLAWSTVLMTRGGGRSSSAQPCSVLAAGGKRGLVKLIHPRNNVAFGEFRASRKSLSVLRFNHRQGNFLFTGSYDNKIVMWDIGGVDSQYNYKVIQLLVLEVSSPPLHLCLPPSSPSQLLTACEDGLYFYKTQLETKSSNKSRSKEMEITFPVYEKEDKDHDYHTVDGLSFLTDDIVASKNFLHSSIYLWSLSRTTAQRPDKKSLRVSAVVLMELQWTSTEVPYLALNTCPARGYIVCGDDKGRLWTYHITDLQKNSFQSGKPVQPTQVLDWPSPMRKGLGGVEGPSINSVAMDPELQYLVALSDKNMVIVWKRD